MKQIYIALFIALLVQSAIAQKSVDFTNDNKFVNSFGQTILQLAEIHQKSTGSRRVKPPLLKSTQATESYIINGLKFNILSAEAKTAELTFIGDTVGDPIKYVGNINVPDKITINKEIYTVTTIGEYAFDYCRDLTAVNLPNTITSIEYAAFYWCEQLTTITLPSSLKYIGFAAFEKCHGITTITIPGNVEIIDDWAFVNNANLQAINLPVSVTSIGEGSFSYCPWLRGINVSADNKHFSSVNGVLFNADKTTIITYPNNYSGSYVLPQSITTINDWAFAGCDQLTSVVLPQSLKSIGYCSFTECPVLSVINFPNSLQSIGEWAFQNCSSLTNILLPESLSVIGKYAFSICPELSSINWPSSVTVINEGMFWKSSKLMSFDVPATVTKIERVVFLEAKSLFAITVNQNNQFYSSLEGVLFNKNKSTLITYPNSKSPVYEVPQSVDSIIGDGFRQCIDLTKITLPSSIMSLANLTFDNCTGLKKITIERNIPPAAFVNTFRNVNKQTCVLKVPDGSVTTYQTANYWNEFNTIINKSFVQSVTLGTYQSYIPVITQRGDSLISSITSGNQWYKNDEPIEGATEQVYVIEETANYYVTVTYPPNQCSSTSESVSMITGLKTVNTGFGFQVFPNPNNGSFNIKLEGDLSGNVQLDLLSVDGKLMSSRKQNIDDGNRMIYMSNNKLTKGIYYLRIISNKGILNKALIVQ